MRNRHKPNYFHHLLLFYMVSEQVTICSLFSALFFFPFFPLSLLRPMMEINQIFQQPLFPSLFWSSQNDSCFYCDRDDHTRETCLKLHGYPPGHPKHTIAKNNHFNPSDNNQSSINNVRETPTMPQILSIMHDNKASQSSTPKANNTTTSLGLSPPELIIYSGATDHITSSSALLVNSKDNTSLPPIVMPNGEEAPIMSTGNLPLSPFIYLKNVLGVPSCKVDLMFVSRITRDLNCSITFFPYWYVCRIWW